MKETGNNVLAKSVSLSDRVRSLRLTEASESSSGGSAWRWLPWVFCAALLGVTGLLALEAFAPINDDMVKKLAEERGLNVGQGTTSTSATSLASLGVKSSASDSSALEIALESKGNIVPVRLIQVSPKISGTVMKLNIEEGKYVEKGFVLAEIEKVEYEAEYKNALFAVKAWQAQVDELQKYRDEEIKQVKAELDDAYAQYEQTSAKYSRVVALKQRSAVAPEEFESAESSYRSMKARVRRLDLAFQLLQKGPRDEKINNMKAEVGKVQANLDKAEWRFNNTKVEAPITGIILSKKTEEGNIVNPSAFSNGLSASLCEMANLYEMEVDLSIAERDIAKLFKDQDCRIRPEAFPNRIYKGYVSRIMPMADRSKSSIPVRVKIEFPAIDAKGQELPTEAQGEYLRPEMGAIVTFLNRKK